MLGTFSQMIIIMAQMMYLMSGASAQEEVEGEVEGGVEDGKHDLHFLLLIDYGY